jgi:hypothetical protein
MDEASAIWKVLGSLLPKMISIRSRSGQVNQIQTPLDLPRNGVFVAPATDLVLKYSSRSEVSNGSS